MSAYHRPDTIYRKLWHMSGLWAPLLYYRALERETAVKLAGGAFLVLVLIEIGRLAWPPLNRLFLRFFARLVRVEEQKSLTTSTYFLLAVFLSVYLFEKSIATVALIFLAVGDPMAALIGTKYGTRRFLGKSIEGSAACFVACFVPAAFLVGIWLAFWGALCATLFELLSSRINDNLSIPIFSGLAMSLLQGHAGMLTPLQIGLVLLRVYFLFVILTGLASIAGRHVLVWLYRKEYRATLPAGPYAPPVSVLKPIFGRDDDMADNLRRFCRQEYAGSYEIIFAAEDPDDPGLAVARRVMAENPDTRIKIVQAAGGAGRHGKVNSLIAAQHAATGEVLLVSDADVKPAPDYVAQMVAPLADPEVGMSTAVPGYRGARNVGAGLKALATNFIAYSIYFPLAYFGKLDSAMGHTLAIKRAVLEEAGGFEAFSHQIADDHALARAVHASGHGIRLIDRPAPVQQERGSLRDWWQVTRRRMVMFRTYIPEKYPVYLFQSGLFHALLYWLVFPGPGARTLVAAVAAAEVLSMAVLTVLYVRDAWTLLWLWLVPPLQVVGPLIWASAYFSNVVVWRGVKYYVEKNGVATRIAET